MFKSTTSYTTPYCVTEHLPYVWEKLQRITPPESVNSAEYFFSLNKILSVGLTQFENFNFYAREGSMGRYEGLFAANCLYACGCSSTQIRDIIPISLKTALSMRTELLSRGCSGIRGKGQPPNLKGPLGLQKHTRLGLLLALCCYVREVMEADDLQSLVSGTILYLRLCDYKGIVPGVDASYLFVIYHPEDDICHLIAKKCTQCHTMFFVDILVPGLTGTICSHCKHIESGRAFKGLAAASLSIHN